MVERADEPLVFRVASRRLLWLLWLGAGVAGAAVLGNGLLIFWESLRASIGPWSLRGVVQVAPQRPADVVQWVVQLQPAFLLPMLFLAVGAAVLGALLLRLWRAMGSFGLYEDRLTLRRGRWPKSVYFSGAERVCPGFWKVSLWQDRTRVDVPYRMPEFHALHEELRARSPVYCEAFELSLPWQLQEERWQPAFLFQVGILAFGFYWLVKAFVLMQEEWDKIPAPKMLATLLVVGLLVMLSQVAMLAVLLPRSFRFEEEAVEVRGLGRVRRYDGSALTCVSYKLSSLWCWFGGSMFTIPQRLVRYPLRELAPQLRRLYLGRETADEKVSDD